MRKPTFFQSLFIKKYFSIHQRLIDRALSNNHYIVTTLYGHRFMFAINYEDTDEWIAELERIGYKLCVVNNIIFIW